LSEPDSEYARITAEVYALYPRVLYHRALRLERDAEGKIVPDGEVFPLESADVALPNYPIPIDVARRNGVKGVVTHSEGSDAIVWQRPYRTCFVPTDWDPQNPRPINLDECQKQEAALIEAGWKRTPSELDLPTRKTVEEESD